MTRTTWCSPARTWTRCRPGRASTTTARAPRSSSSSPSRSPSAGTPPRNKIRFLWFGGEEDGLVGSQYYAAHLSDAEVDKIDVMIDTDMIASPNFARLVYDGDGSTLGANSPGPAGSGTVERCSRDYWAERGMVSEPIPFDGRSDYVGFVNRGIPRAACSPAPRRPRRPAQVAHVRRRRRASSSTRATTSKRTPLALPFVTTYQGHGLSRARRPDAPRDLRAARRAPARGRRARRRAAGQPPRRLAAPEGAQGRRARHRPCRRARVASTSRPGGARRAARLPRPVLEPIPGRLQGGRRATAKEVS